MAETNGSLQLEDLQCPRCGAPRMGVVDGKRLTCSHCGADFIIAETVCPACGNVGESRTDYCARCGGAISRICAACGTRNWANAEHCEHCGHELDAIEEMSTRWAHRTQHRLTQQMNDAVEIKRREAQAADARSAALWEIEQRRQAQVQRDLTRQRQQEQRIVYIAVAGIVLVIVIILVLISLQPAG